MTNQQLLDHESVEDERRTRGPDGTYRFNIREILSTLKLLLHSPNLDVNKRNDEGNTVLHYCALQIDGHKLEVTLKSAKQAGIDVNIRNNDGETPTHFAFSNSIHGFVESDHAKIMLKYGKEVGIDFEARDNRGRTPIHYLCKDNCEEKVQKFLRLAKTRFDIEFNLDATDEDGKIPFDLLKIQN